MIDEPTCNREAHAKADHSAQGATHDHDEEAAGDGMPLAGERFGRYLLVGELATGGMAEIFLAVHEGVEGVLKVVALKRVLPHLSHSPEFTQMFIDEARIVARLDHPNIVRTYEFDEFAGQYFTVMEYLAGEDLRKVLNRIVVLRQPLPLELATSIVSQVCSGLHFAHELTDGQGRPLGLVHRDVTPSNIIVTFTGEVKLIDFGVAKVNLVAGRTLVGTIKGKVAYMSPEQVRARGVDRRSDVFSTGVVLWELLAGRPLFARKTEAETLNAIANGPIPSVRRLRPEVPEQLEAIVLRALARNPKARFQSAEDMQSALDQVLSALPKIAAGAKGTPPGPRDTSPRALSRTMEQLFGVTRTNAKRSIAQTRSLTRNISLVMKLRTTVCKGLVEYSDHHGDHHSGPPPGHTSAAAPAVVAPSRSYRARGLASLALIIGAGAVITYLVAQRAELGSPAKLPLASATLTIASTPPGAAIFLAGEPTGMTAPATLPSITAGLVTVRLELAGYQPAETTVTVAPGAHVSKQIELTLARPPGRLIFTNLPSGSIVIVDGSEHAAGEVIPITTGHHDVRLLIEGQPVVQRVIESLGGDQVWELHNHQLMPKK